jgi:MFS family permease
MKRSIRGASTRKIADFLGLERNIAVLLGAIIIALTGERLWLGFASKYLETLGAGVFLIGLFDALQTLLGAVYAYPGAWLTDRLGQKKSLLVFSLISILGYLIVYIWPSRFALLVGVFFFSAWSSLSLPATFAVVATRLKRKKHTMGIGVQSLVRRVPMMLGPLIGGWLISRDGWQKGVQEALLTCMGFAVATFVLQLVMFDDDAPGKKEDGNGLSVLGVFRAFPAHLRELLLSDILIRFCERIPYAFIILWAIDLNGISAEKYGVLTAIEMVAAMFCYIPVAYLADKYGQQPFILTTFVFFTLFPVSLLFAHNFAMFALAFAVRGMKEFGEPARKALIIAYAPPALQSKAYGVYYLIRDCIVTTGSFVGAALWKVSPQASFLGAALCGLAGTAWFYFYVFRKRHERAS